MTSLKALDSTDSYTIAWISALLIERAAAEAMLDQDHEPPTISLDTSPTRTFIHRVGWDSITL
ncbi:hypothetical protein VD0004_g7280 [Verticillium dahliae]|nr:hypothetical protein VD0004_g7280 [Verticillium dahliae]PNH73750.1 hypothetical protein VD0001_g3822 [Verticillium dahliae]